MDYKYIEQLLDRYWACETSEEEERILKAFFSQKDVPAALVRYRALFVYETEQCAASTLGDDFDRRVMEAAGVADGAEAPAAGVWCRCTTLRWGAGCVRCGAPLLLWP